MNERKQFATKFGSFSANGKEFVITTPKTPRPWVNVVSNGDTGFILSQTGGGYSWRGNGQLNRLTRWEQDVAKDEWGKYLYIRDVQSGDLWSASWKPMCAEPDSYQVRHGSGYSVITARNKGIETEWTLFVAPDEPVEIWKLVIRNCSRKVRKVQVFTYFEWCLGAAPDWHREFHKCFTETSFDRGSNAIIAVKRLWEVPSDGGHWNVDWPYVAFHGVNVAPASFDCSKEVVLGAYGSFSSPDGIRKGALKRTLGQQLDPVASLQVSLSLRPQESHTLTYTLGAGDSKDQATSLARRYHSIEEVDRALDRVTSMWEKLLNVTVVKTPDASIDLLVNRWLKYQSISGRLWARTGYYQAGGAYGFRDQLQDSQIFLSLDPAETKKQILLHARHQFKDGTVYHWWHPLSEVGLRTEMTDDLLWLPFVVIHYLEETSDFSLLDCTEGFVDDSAGASVYDHCIRAIEKTLQRMSPRGLPLIGAGDWNDGLSAAGLKMKGESVWLGEFLFFILKQFASVAKRKGDVERGDRFIRLADELRHAVNREGWDGEWYYYGTKDSGEKFGSNENQEGSIHLNPQTWAVIADVADNKRAHQVMDQVRDRLEFKAGTVLLAPAYRTPDKELGYLTRYAPGTRENGATYTHAATWSVIAAAKLGRAEEAYRYLSKINPIIRGKRPEEYCGEPYVTAGNIDGPDSRFYGRGGWTWYSGSAAWMYKAALEWILGVRASADGLLVSPCIPSKWKGYKVRRLFRGMTYEIEVRNPKHVSEGITRVLVDGTDLAAFKPCRQVILPQFDRESSHTIVVEMGKLDAVAP
ncbi:MAG: glycosyl transferase family 36 [Bacteroidota bacterium]